MQWLITLPFTSQYRNAPMVPARQGDKKNIWYTSNNWKRKARRYSSTEATLFLPSRALPSLRQILTGRPRGKERGTHTIGNDEGGATQKWRYKIGGILIFDCCPPSLLPSFPPPLHYPASRATHIRQTSHRTRTGTAHSSFSLHLPNMNCTYKSKLSAIERWAHQAQMWRNVLVGWLVGWRAIVRINRTQTVQ